MYFTQINSEPSQLAKYLNQHVRVELDTKAFIDLSQVRSLSGWVYTIDPVSFSLVLIDESKQNATLLMNDDIKDLILTNEKSIDLSDMFQSSAPQSEFSFVQRDKLVSWLKENRLPVEIESDGSISILNTVYIRPPYGVDNCESTNEIILDKVRNLVLQLIKNEKI